MAGNLSFDVTARDSASREFLAIAAQLKALSKQISALDGQQARVKVALSGAEQAQAQLAAVGAQLRGLPNSVSTRVAVDLDRSIGERLGGLGSGISRLASTASAAAPALGLLRTASQALIDPTSLPVVERVSAAISGRFHGAVDKARVVVDRLSTANRVLAGSLVGLGAVGNAVQVIGGVTAALTQLSGAAVLLPGVLLGAAAAMSTFKVGMAGFADAVKADTPKKFADATENMSKSALFAVVAVRQLTSAMKGTGEVGGSVQTAMFRGISDQIYALNKTYIPVLKTGMTGIATGFNAMGREALVAVGKASSVRQVQAIFANTSTAVGNMRLSLANAATGFLTLGKAGSTYLPRLGAAIDQAAGKFNTWAQRVTSDGSFDRWAEGGITAFRQLGTIIGNVGSIFGSVLGSLSASGGGALASFARLTGVVKDFLRSVQGTAALEGFGKTVTAAGDALSQVLGAALKAVGPLLVALGPALQTLATSIGAQLSGAIERVTPALKRFAELLSQNPEVLANIARAVGIAAISFGPLVAVLGIAATLLKGLLLARLAAAAIGALGLQGTLAARVIQALASPLTALRTLLPLIARGAGSLAASLLLAAGPIGALIVGFAALYASSSQFRAGVDDIAGTLGRLFVQALRDAGAIINSTVILIRDIGGALDSATSGVQGFGSSVMSVFGPLGRAVSGALSGLFDILGKLPGAALAAVAAFKVFGLIAPLFVAASTAAAGFAARMAAVQASTAIGAAAAAGMGRAAGVVSTALSKVGAALPLIGVALIALGFAYDAVRDKSADAAQAVVTGSATMSQAIATQVKALESQNTLWRGMDLFATESDKAREAQERLASASASVRAEVEKQVSQLGPLEQAQARVRISTQNLQDLQASGTATAEQLAAAQAVLARDQAGLSTVQQRLETATRGTTAAMQAQADQMAAQATSMLGYEASLRQVTSAQQAADDAIKKNGVSSNEAKDAIGSLATAQLDAAGKAKELAAANGALDGGTKAYLTTLAAMPRDTAAGAAGFTKLASTMSQTELDMISAAAAATGLRTEIVNVPGGKTVRVVAEVDQAKAIQKLQTDLQNLKDKTVNINGNAQPLADAVKTVTSQVASSGVMVNIDGNTVPAADALNTVLGQIAQGRSFVVIDGQAVPADQALQTFLAKVGTSGGMVTINGETMPAAQALALLLQTANGSTATSKLNFDPASANNVLNSTLTLSNGATGTMKLDANGAPAEAVLNGTKYKVDTTTGILTIDGNPAPGQADLSGLKVSIDRTTGVVTILGRDGGVAALKAQLSQPSSSTHTVRVRQVIETVGMQYAPGPQRAGGGIVGYSGGGIVAPLRAARGMVLPGYAPGRDTELSLLSKGEAVLVPELVRALGARRIMDANAEASGGRPATVTGSVAGIMDGTISGYAGGGIRAEDGSTVNSGFYSKISPQLRASQDGRGIASGEIAAATWASLLTKGWRAVAGRLYYPGTGPRVTAPPPPAKAMTTVARGSVSRTGRPDAGRYDSRSSVTNIHNVVHVTLPSSLTAMTSVDKRRLAIELRDELDSLTRSRS